MSEIPGTCEVFEANSHNESDGMDEQPAVLGCGIDYLCIGLRDLSMRLRRLVLEDVRISPALFWPQDDEPGKAAPYWPNLTYMRDLFAQIDASGKYGFLSYAISDIPNPGKWYTTPDPEHLPARLMFAFFGKPDDIRWGRP